MIKKKMKKSIKNLLVIPVILLVLTNAISALPEPIITIADSIQAERDEILSLAALAIVYKDWQISKDGRGYNIGAILANEQGEPVFWARNSVGILDNATQHAEVRLIQNYLDCPCVGKYADKYTVYTTLEPCAMCSGLLALAKVKRVVYLQRDPGFGNAHEALKAIKYPRVYEQSTPLKNKQKLLLEHGFQSYMAEKKDSNITNYLFSEEARKIFASSIGAIENFKLIYQENQKVLSKVQSLISGEMPETYGADMIEKKCPKKK